MNSWSPRVNVFPARLPFCLLPQCMALVWKHSSPSSHLLSIHWVWCLLALHRHTPSSPLSVQLFCLIHNIIHNFLDCLKSCEVIHNIWAQLSPAETHCFRFVGFHGFFYDINSIISGVILPDFLWRFSSRALNILPLEDLMLWTLKAFMTLWSRDWLRDIMFGGKQITLTLFVLNLGVLGDQRALSNIKRTLKGSLLLADTSWLQGPSIVGPNAEQGFSLSRLSCATRGWMAGVSFFPFRLGG